VAGLPDGIAWNVFQGGSGFAPPYALPAQNAVLTAVPSTSSCSPEGSGSDRLAVQVTAGPSVARTFETDPATANKYIRSLAQGRLPPPAQVFCSRELENGLVAYVTDLTEPFGLGRFPSDEELRAKARDILGTPGTAADDAVLLEKFKGMIRQKLGLGLGAPTTVSTGQGSLGQGPSSSAAAGAAGLGSMPLGGMALQLTDGQLTDILGGMDFQFGDMEGLDDAVLGPGFGM
jgi:hypothetical protein